MRIGRLAATAAVAAALAVGAATGARADGMMSYSEMQEKLGEMSGGNGLSSDFFDADEWDSFKDAYSSGLEGGMAKLDFKARKAELEAEAKDADEAVSTDGFHAAAYVSELEDGTAFAIVHVMTSDPSAVRVEDGKVAFTDPSTGKDALVLETTGEAGPATVTSGNETALTADGGFAEPERGKKADELAESGTIGLWKTGSPLTGGESAGGDGTTTSAVGQAYVGDLYVLVCPKGMADDDAATLLARQGCTFSSKLGIEGVEMDGRELEVPEELEDESESETSEAEEATE